MDDSSTLPAPNLPDSKDLLCYIDPQTNRPRYLDLRTGRPYEAYVPTIVGGGFSNELADIITAQIREGDNLAKTCKDNYISLSQFYAWLAVFPEFKKRYTEARKQRADYHFHKAIDIADGAMGAPKEMIPGIKLAVDTHKWAAEKSDPERFAKPKEDVNVGSITINLQTGVLDTQPPKDIVVDQFGNFMGFGEANGTEGILENGAGSFDMDAIELGRDRWAVREDTSNEDGEATESTSRENTEESGGI